MKREIAKKEIVNQPHCISTIYQINYSIVVR